MLVLVVLVAVISGLLGVESHSRHHMEGRQMQSDKLSHARSKQQCGKRLTTNMRNH